MLADDELAEIWALYLDERNPDALEVLMRQYSSLAGYLARRALAKAPPHQSAEDILSYAHHGLVDAIQRFDPTAGAKFETYATRRITGAIVDGQRKEDPLARATRRKVKLLQAATEECWERYHREPTIEELADTLGETPAEVRMTMLFRQSLNSSLEAVVEGGDEKGLDSEAETLVHLADARSLLAMRLARLGPRARAFVAVFYCDDVTLKEAGEKMGISSESCRQTRNQLLEELGARKPA